MQKGLEQSMLFAHHRRLLQGAIILCLMLHKQNHQISCLRTDFYVVCFRVKSQLKRIARPMYSNPPVHGARIVANIVGDSALFKEWNAEMEMMAGRIKNVRHKLFDNLSSKDKSGKDWSFVLKQIGMFSFTGLNKAQVTSLSNLYVTWIPTKCQILVCFQH